MPSCRLHLTKTHLALFHTQGFEDREEQARVQQQAGFLPRTQEPHAASGFTPVGNTQLFCPQDFEDREEQARVQEAAQILMDCIADIVDHHGLGPLRHMAESMQVQS